MRNQKKQLQTPNRPHFPPLVLSICSPIHTATYGCSADNQVTFFGKSALDNHEFVFTLLIGIFDPSKEPRLFVFPSHKRRPCSSSPLRILKLAPTFLEIILNFFGLFLVCEILKGVFPIFASSSFAPFRDWFLFCQFWWSCRPSKSSALKQSNL